MKRERITLPDHIDAAKFADQLDAAAQLVGSLCWSDMTPDMRAIFTTSGAGRIEHDFPNIAAEIRNEIFRRNNG